MAIEFARSLPGRSAVGACPHRSGGVEAVEPGGAQSTNTIWGAPGTAVNALPSSSLRTTPSESPRSCCADQHGSTPRRRTATPVRTRSSPIYWTPARPAMRWPSSSLTHPRPSRGRVPKRRTVAAAPGHPPACGTNAELLRRFPTHSPAPDAVAWSAIAVPTLVIGHTDDPFHPWPIAETTAARISGAQLVQVPSKDREPRRFGEEINLAIRSFLDRSPGVNPRQERLPFGFHAPARRQRHVGSTHPHEDHDHTRLVQYPCPRLRPPRPKARGGALRPLRAGRRYVGRRCR